MRLGLVIAVLCAAGWAWAEGVAPSAPAGTLSPIATTTAVAANAAADKNPPPKKLEYNRDIRPILAENCFACHGPDSAARKGDLRLDRREDAIAAKAITPGKPDASSLLDRIESTSEEEQMPPPATKKKLSAEQKARLKEWIAAGAEYEPHWSFLTPTRPAVPAVKQSSWVRNPIDAFVLAKLEERGLSPAPEADRRTLIRRVSLDLTGLPPTAEEVAAVANDPSPQWYESYVQKLMQSPHWGEHRGRYWLDLARYGDTHGIHFDNFREMWTYRDAVIAAFNRNQPFDQFTIEQLAGDLLPNRTMDQQIASGFNRCNITTNEGGVIAEEFLVHYTRDRTETTSQVWLGLTTGCSTCHDHKFDPVSQREFYELAAFFNNTTQGAMDGNIKDTPPILFVPLPADRERWNKLDGEIAAVRKSLDADHAAARPEFDKWLATASTANIPAVTLPTEGLHFHAKLDEASGPTVAVSLNGQPRTVKLAKEPAKQPGVVASKAHQISADSIVALEDAGDFDVSQGFSYGAWVKLASANQFGAVIARMQKEPLYRGWDLWVENGRVAAHLVNSWDRDAIKVSTNEPIKIGEWTHVFVTYDGTSKASGVRIFVNGKPQATTPQVDRLRKTIKTKVPLKIGQRDQGQRLDNLLVQDVRVYSRRVRSAEVLQLASATRVAQLVAQKSHTDAEKQELFKWWLTTQHQPYLDLQTKLTTLEQDQAAIKGRATIAHVMQERGNMAKAYILHRGEYDKRRDEVRASTPAILPPMPTELPRNRLGFAKWLLLPNHPLTARVTVNRFWQEVFGTGLVKTSGDFGVAGELPTHPELLDWLAVDFRESGWDVQRFYKLLVTSATYRQAAVATRDKLEKDPANRFLSRGPRFRLDGELIRDGALASSGLLVRKLGGPSVRPYQPEGVWEAVAMIGSNTRDYRRDSGEKLYRRSMYTFWKRAAPPASMEIFNAPTRENCTVRRERTNTPLQALVTLNDPQFVEAARHLAQRALLDGGATDESRFDYIYQRLVARSPRAEELAILKTSLADLAAHYQSRDQEAAALISYGESKPDPQVNAKTLAAWTMLTNQLFNLDEVLNK